MTGADGVQVLVASAASTSVATLIEQAGTRAAAGGWIGAAVIMLVIASPAMRFVATAVFAVVGGLGLTAVLQFVIGTLDGNYWVAALGAMLGIGATATAVLGLRTLLGGPGRGIAAVALIRLGDPLSGLTSAPEPLPTPWGAIGQFVPPGATGQPLRSLAFFDGHGALHPALVPAGWLAGGAVLFLLGVARQRGRGTPRSPSTRSSRPSA